MHQYVLSITRTATFPIPTSSHHHHAYHIHLEIGNARGAKHCPAVLLSVRECGPEEPSQTLLALRLSFLPFHRHRREEEEEEEEQEHEESVPFRPREAGEG